MAEKVELTEKQKKGCLIGCLVPIVFIVIIFIIAAAMDAGTKNEKKNAAKKASDTSLSLAERVEGAVIGAVGKENNMSESRNIKVDASGDITQITLMANESMTTKMNVTSMHMDTVDIMEALQPIEELKTVGIAWQTNFVDTYGNKSVNDAMRLFIYKDEIDKINFENFNSDNVKGIAYSYMLHPAFK